MLQATKPILFGWETVVKIDPSAETHRNLALTINRHLFDKRGSDLIVALARFVTETKLFVSDESLELLTMAIKSVRPKVAV